MLYSTATTIFLCLSSTLLSAAAPIPLHVRADKKGKEPSTHKSAEGLVFPSSANDDGKAFGVQGKFKTGTSELRNDGDSAVLVGKYPKGSYAGAKIAGFIFKADGGADLDHAKEAILTYEVKFPNGFDFQEGGKIPGLFGGDNDQIAGTCAGGHHNDKCWSARLMWRKGGEGELYGYLPTVNKGKKFCGKNDELCSAKYGASIQTGAWTFKPGKWTTLTERIRLNEVGGDDGEIEVSVDGDSKIHIKQVKLRTSEAGRIRGIMMHTFFGGSSSNIWASPKDQEALFRNFNLKVTKTLDGKNVGGSDGEGSGDTEPEPEPTNKKGDKKGDKDDGKDDD